MILIQIIIISCIVFAIHYTFLPGEIFGFITKDWDRYKDNLLHLAGCGETKKQKAIFRWYMFLDKIQEPMFACPVCMAPWHGTYLYWFIPWRLIGLPDHHFVAWFVIIISCLGLNSIIVRTFKEQKDD